MTKKEFKELKKLSRFFWNQAKLLEREFENRFQGVDLIEWNRIKTKSETYKYASTMLSVCLEKLKSTKDNSTGKGCIQIAK